MPNPYLVLIDTTKTLPIQVSWSPAEGDGCISFLSPLDVAGVTPQNFFLRGKAYEQYVDKAVTLQIEIGLEGQRTRIPIMRLDWRPLSRHNNRGIGPDRLRWLQQDSHLHPCIENWVESRGSMRTGNLPVAIPLDPDPIDFKSVLEISKTMFRINNLETIPTPPWAPRFL
jgi:hypothetical protein